MGKLKNAQISDFISEKRLKKITKVIDEASLDSMEKYEKIASLLEEKGFVLKDCGTNRQVFIHEDWDKVVFKVACDTHGVEANQREYANSNIDDYLVKSYCISPEGNFLVQEKVIPFTSEDMKEHKDEVRDMLKHLSKRILLVDCKLINFKNFGFRKNGDICLLDHGDTVPLPKYQNDDNSINSDEECFASLRCKANLTEESLFDEPKRCKGKLKYGKDFSFLVCEKCGKMVPVDAAYRQFVGDELLESPVKQKVQTTQEYEKQMFEIHQQQLSLELADEEDESQVSSNINNNMEEEEMKEKIVEFKKDGELKKVKCTLQLKGYWIPEEYTTGMYALQIAAMKNPKSSIAPNQFLDKNGFPHEYFTVKKCEHEPRANGMTNKEESEANKIAKEKLVKQLNSNEYETMSDEDKAHVDEIVDLIVALSIDLYMNTEIHSTKLDCKLFMSDEEIDKYYLAIAGRVNSNEFITSCIANFREEKYYAVRVNENYIENHQSAIPESNVEYTLDDRQLKRISRNYGYFDKENNVYHMTGEKEGSVISINDIKNKMIVEVVNHPVKIERVDIPVRIGKSSLADLGEVIEAQPDIDPFDDDDEPEIAIPTIIPNEDEDEETIEEELDEAKFVSSEEEEDEQPAPVSVKIENKQQATYTSYTLIEFINEFTRKSNDPEVVSAIKEFIADIPNDGTKQVEISEAVNLMYGLLGGSDTKRFPADNHLIATAMTVVFGKYSISCEGDDDGCVTLYKGNAKKYKEFVDYIESCTDGEIEDNKRLINIYNLEPEEDETLESIDSEKYSLGKAIYEYALTMNLTEQMPGTLCEFVRGIYDTFQTKLVSKVKSMNITSDDPNHKSVEEYKKEIAEFAFCKAIFTSISGSYIHFSHDIDADFSDKKTFVRAIADTMPLIGYDVAAEGDDVSSADLYEYIAGVIYDNIYNRDNSKDIIYELEELVKKYKGTGVDLLSLSEDLTKVNMNILATLKNK